MREQQVARHDERGFGLALALLSVPALGLATMLGPDSPLYSDGAVVEDAWMLLLAAPFWFAGALLLRRLLRPRRDRPTLRVAGVAHQEAGLP